MTKDESAMLVECHSMLTKITKQIEVNDAKNGNVAQAAPSNHDATKLDPGEGTYDPEIDGRWI